MITEDQFFFMFSSKNPDNLWNKPYFILLLIICFILSLLYSTYPIGEYILFIIGIQIPERLHILYSLIGLLTYLTIVLLSWILYIMIIEFIIPLCNEIKSSIKTHDEMMKMKKI